jgi:hypothetical protein
MPDRPLSLIMTPMQEQQAMQDYIRQRLAMGWQQPPTLPGGGGVPSSPGAPPGLPSIPGSYGVGSGPPIDVSRGGGPPGLDFNVNLGGNRMRDVRQGAVVPDIMYRRNIPF